MNGKTWNAEPEIWSDSYCQTKQNPQVAEYGSGFGLRSSCWSGFRSGQELNRLVFAVQTRTPGRLPRTIPNTSCNIYSCMKFDWLHQLVQGLYNDHTWEWIVGFLEHIYGKEKGLDLIDERFSIVLHFCNIQQFGEKLTCVKQWTDAQYQDMVKVWLRALAPLLTGHPYHLKFITSISLHIACQLPLPHQNYA